MHTKYCESQSYLFQQSPLELVKFSSRGLLGEDRQRLIKRSGSEELAYLASQLKLAEDEVPGHLIAMGATEFFGPNRNGDGWKEAMLIRCCPTFVTHAKAYRGHDNKNPKKSYGDVKLAYYNKSMGRVELLVAYNGSEKIAKEKQGLLADEECQLLLSGKDYPVSMASHVPHDVCSACFNQAPTRKEYCKSAEEGGSCTLFGCSRGLMKVSDDGHVQHVDNPSGVFFDISKVGRPADRTAYGSFADYLGRVQLLHKK